MHETNCTPSKQITSTLYGLSFLYYKSASHDHSTAFLCTRWALHIHVHLYVLCMLNYAKLKFFETIRERKTK